MTCTLILVRHGETAWNQVKRIQGQIDIPLADTGHRQAALLAARLQREIQAGRLEVVDNAETDSDPQADADANVTQSPRHLGAPGPITAVFSSDLSRAMQTAEPLATALGVEVIPEAGLRERHFGVFQAHDTTQIAQLWPAEHSRWQSHDPDFAPAEGESLRQFYTRVVSTLGRIARSHAGQSVICVAHGGVLDCAYRFATSRPLDAARSYLLLNASVNVLRWHTGSGTDPLVDDRATAEVWADIAHLAAEEAVRDDT